MQSKRYYKQQYAGFLNYPPYRIISDLGKITGDDITEDIINEIFSKFCLGK